MKQIRVTGGYADTVTAAVREVAGGDMSGLSLKAALVAEGVEVQPPAANAVAWKDGTVTISGSQASVELTVNDSTAAGHYWLWLRVQQGVKLPVVVLVMDDESGRPLHIYVT